jgi:ATP-dependent Clp protease ATP-binding subunit ClpC
MFDRFTDRAKKVMSFARQEAQKFNHEYIGTEHILLGLVQEGSGVAANVLKNMTVDLDKIRHEVEKIVKTGPRWSPWASCRSRRAPRRCSSCRSRRPAKLGHNYIGTEHLLLGLIRENEGIAAQVLMNLGVKLEEVREEVLEFLGASENNSERTARAASRRAAAVAQSTAAASERRLRRHADRATARARRRRSTRSAATSPSSPARASSTR